MGLGVVPTAAQPFQFVSEREDVFLSLFPHRFDFIYAPHSQPGAAPQWHTERRYPLSDRCIRQGKALYGVRFGKTTQYALIDIDRTSAYHPQQDPWAIARLQAALESLGLVESLICTSSHSGGLHLYLPFAGACVSWKLAIALAAVLEQAGFCLRPGQLEIFPNVRPFSEQLSLFHAHRLPLQMGSYLLDDNFSPVHTTEARFVQRWHQAQSRNQLDALLVERLVKQQRRLRRPVSRRAEQFLEDLNLEIEAGWTGPGQTNRLLGRIVLRTYVFHHVLEGGQPLTGQALINQAVAIARALPGYEEWCNHQYEIEQRAAEWVRSVEASKYFPYGSSASEKSKTSVFDAKSTSVENSVNRWNTQQETAAREKIKGAIADLLNQNQLPTGITARFKILTQSGIGGSSLYRHRDLWHPNFLSESYEAESIVNSDSVENSVENFDDQVEVERFKAIPTSDLDKSKNLNSEISLLDPSGRNSNPGQGFSLHAQFASGAIADRNALWSQNFQVPPQLEVQARFFPGATLDTS
jgi:hypothetical protein